MLDRMNLYRPVIYGMLAISGLAAGASYFFVDLRLFSIFLASWGIMALWAAIHCSRISRDTRRQLAAIRGSLLGAREETVAEYPMATMIVRETGEVLWQNDYCRQRVLDRSEEHI